MDEKTRKDFLDLLKKSNPRQRNTTIYVVEGKASEDGIGYVREEMSFLEQDLTTRRVTFASSRLCDCNRLVTKDNALKGTCSHHGCRRYLCESCVMLCDRCRRNFCASHTRRYRDGSVYCIKCRPVKWVKIFFAIEDNRKKT